MLVSLAVVRVEAATTALTDGVSTHGQLSVQGTQLVDASGKPFQLRGMSTHGIAWFPEFLNAGAFTAVRAAGGNVIRIAMYTDTGTGSDYLANPDYSISLVNQAVSIAETLDMYAIIDWHILSDGNPLTHVDQAITFFDQMSTQYKDDPHILYEICNEPNGVEWDAVTSYANQVIPVIRANDPDAVILVGTPYWSSLLERPLKAPLSYDNIMYTFHFYAGMHDNYNGLIQAVDAGLPVFVTEWGIDYDQSGSQALKAGSDFASYLNEKGLSWCAWSLCNKDEIYSLLRPGTAADGSWDASAITDVGKVLLGAMQGSH